MKFLSLFAGIGGFDLGLERAGMTCVGQVEIEPFCQKVLAKHWPNVWRWNDVKTLTGELVKTHCGTVDLLCGGVPCQPASVAGKRLGAADHRWLWPDFLRLVSEVEPVWVLAENPRGVLSLDVAGMRFSEWIANEFAARGYELLPVKLAAEDVGAPHRRERIFIIAYSNGNRLETNINHAILRSKADYTRKCRHSEPMVRPSVFHSVPRRAAMLSNSLNLGRTNGVSRKVDRLRLKALGNAIVPQVAEVIGRAIMQMEEGER